MPREIIPLPPLEPHRGYSVLHAALYLDCSVPTVYGLLRDGWLASLTLGKKRILPGHELIRFLTGKDPTMAGDPIDPQLAAVRREAGRAGGLAKARRLERHPQARKAGTDK